MKHGQWWSEEMKVVGGRTQINEGEAEKLARAEGNYLAAGS